jgi:hypothetical protein
MITIIEYGIFAFLIGWALTSILSKAILFVNYKWLQYICQKCITMWTSLATIYLITHNLYISLFAALIGAFLAYTYQKLEEDE